MRMCEPSVSWQVAEALPAWRVAGGRFWPDICLAASAHSSGLRMVTFVRDFQRFGLERCLVLQGDADASTCC